MLVLMCRLTWSNIGIIIIGYSHVYIHEGGEWVNFDGVLIPALFLAHTVTLKHSGKLLISIFSSVTV